MTTIAATNTRINSSGHVHQGDCMQVMNTLHAIKLVCPAGHTRMYSLCAQLLQTNLEYCIACAELAGPIKWNRPIV